MAYTLTLTAAERKAIDWVGNRYAHGHDLYMCLWLESEPADIEWDSEEDITLRIPEPVAWTISEIIDADGLACFGADLRSKLYEFQGKIV